MSVPTNFASDMILIAVSSSRMLPSLLDSTSRIWSSNSFNLFLFSAPCQVLPGISRGEKKRDDFHSVKSDQNQTLQILWTDTQFHKKGTHFPLLGKPQIGDEKGNCRLKRAPKHRLILRICLIYIMEGFFWFFFNGERKKPEAQAHSFVVQDRVVLGQQQLPKADQITRLWWSWNSKV